MTAEVVYAVWELDDFLNRGIILKVCKTYEGASDFASTWTGHSWQRVHVGAITVWDD